MSGNTAPAGVPQTQAEWDSHLNADGRGRMNKTSIMTCFQMDKKALNAVIAEVQARIQATPGMSDLVARCRGIKEGKGAHDQTSLNAATKKLESWLSRRSGHVARFGSTNKGASQKHKDEAVRQIVFSAKQKVYDSVQKEEAGVKSEFNCLPTPPAPPLFASAQPVFQSQHAFALHSPVTPHQHDSPFHTGEHFTMPASHRLLINRLPNLRSFNVRVLDSRSHCTIIRLPFRHIVNDKALLETSAGVLDGDDIGKDELEDFIKDNAPIEVVQLWKDHGNSMGLTSTGEDINNQNDFCVAINDYIGGPRSHADFCVTLNVGNGQPAGIELDLQAMPHTIVVDDDELPDAPTPTPHPRTRSTPFPTTQNTSSSTPRSWLPTSSPTKRVKISDPREARKAATDEAKRTQKLAADLAEYNDASSDKSAQFKDGADSEQDSDDSSKNGELESDDDDVMAFGDEAARGMSSSMKKRKTKRKRGKN